MFFPRPMTLFCCLNHVSCGGPGTECCWWSAWEIRSNIYQEIWWNILTVWRWHLSLHTSMAGHESSDDKQSGNNALQYITHYTALPPFVTQQTVFTMSTQMIQRHQIYCQRGPCLRKTLSQFSAVFGGFWLIMQKKQVQKLPKKTKARLGNVNYGKISVQILILVFAVCRLH